MLLSLCLLTLVKCGKDGPLDIFIPNLANAWASDRGTSFLMSATTQGVNESTFTGTEQSPSTGNIDDFNGKFKNYDIEFTFTSGTETGKKYIGKFIKGSSPLKIEARRSDDPSIRVNLTQF